MTKREALRQAQQENTLLDLGFTRAEAEQLRRISMTLHRWSERECGSDSACLVRGRWNRETQEFEYDDNGQPYEEYANGTGKHRYHRVPDRERGALARLKAIITARNNRLRVDNAINDVLGSIATSVQSFIQGDPRGAALYILRPGDVPEGRSAESYYNRGVCIY